MEQYGVVVYLRILSLDLDTLQKMLLMEPQSQAQMIVLLHPKLLIQGFEFTFGGGVDLPQSKCSVITITERQ